MADDSNAPDADMGDEPQDEGDHTPDMPRQMIDQIVRVSNDWLSDNDGVSASNEQRIRLSEHVAEEVDGLAEAHAFFYLGPNRQMNVGFLAREHGADRLEQI